MNCVRSKDAYTQLQGTQVATLTTCDEIAGYVRRDGVVFYTDKLNCVLRLHEMTRAQTIIRISFMPEGRDQDSVL